MIILSITTALQNDVEHEWVGFMKNDHIPSLMEEGMVDSFRFVRVMPQEGVDVAYNLQLRFVNIQHFNDFQTHKGPQFAQIQLNKYPGKIAQFSTVLEELANG